MSILLNGHSCSILTRQWFIPSVSQWIVIFVSWEKLTTASFRTKSHLGHLIENQTSSTALTWADFCVWLFHHDDCHLIKEEKVMKKQPWHWLTDLWRSLVKGKLVSHQPDLVLERHWNVIKVFGCWFLISKTKQQGFKSLRGQMDDWWWYQRELKVTKTKNDSCQLGSATT